MKKNDTFGEEIPLSKQDAKDLEEKGESDFDKAKQRVQLINKVYAMFNARGIKVKKKSFVSKTGFGRAVTSCEWSDVERGMLQGIAIQYDRIF